MLELAAGNDRTVVGWLQQKKEDSMDAANIHANVPLEPLAALTDPSSQQGRSDGTRERPVQVSSTSVRIHGLTTDRPAIVAYFDHIAPDKLEIALVHALEVGITELVARRERFKK
jgi:hypothetical protein